MNITVIRADISHADFISAIGKSAFPNAFGHLFKNKEELDEYLEFTYHPKKLAVSLRKENNVYFLAMLDGKPAGFAKVKKHSLNENIESVAQMELQKIYVLPECQGSGAGSMLLREVKRLARDIYPDYIWLDTYVGNEKAIRLYEKNGFQKIGRHYFTIGTQTFEYVVMGWPVVFKVKNAC